METKSKRRIIYTKLSKPILSLKELENLILSKRLNIKYNKFKTNITFYRYFTGKFLYKKHCRITSFFEEFLLYNNNEEFIKKMFNYEDAVTDLIRYALIYKDYVAFYCFPMITNFFYNGLIVDCIEAKAEIYYDYNFKENKQKKENSKDNGIIIYSKRKSGDENESKNEIVKSFFNEALRKQIDSYSPDKINCSKVQKEDTSLLISSSNENAVNQLMEELNTRQSKENININILKSNNNINSSRILNNAKIAFDNNMKKINKLNRIYKNYKENKNSNNNNIINNYTHKEKTFFINSNFHKNKNNNNFIKTINLYNFDKTKNDKNSFNFGYNKSALNINNSLQKSISIINSRRTMNSIDFRPKKEKQRTIDRTLFSLKNRFNNNLKKREIITKTPNQSLIIKLNKVIKINNNIININIIKSKKEKNKSMIINDKKKHNFKLINKGIIQNKSNDINQIIESNKIYSRNKHKHNNHSKSSRYLSSRKINLNKNYFKEYSNFSKSKKNRIIYNKNNQNSLTKKAILKPSIFSNYNTKHIINNENFIKCLNISSINNYKTNKNYSNRIINMKGKIITNKKFGL